MLSLNLPEYKLSIRRNNNTDYIMDVVRKKYLVLTPEEWVRQNLISYLMLDLNYPGSLISVEAGLKVHALSKRYDALVYSRKMTPLVLIECKAPEIEINQNVFTQITSYNSKIRAPYMLVSNGLKHFFLKLNNENKFTFLNRIPAFNEL